MSVKHLGRYINEFSACYNYRPSDTIDQMVHMVHMVQGMGGKRLRYRDLTQGDGPY